MASPFLSCINSVLGRLGAIPNTWTVPKGRAANLFQYVAMWNNQVERQKEGKVEFDTPAAFLELIHPIKWNQLNFGVNQADITFRVHIVDQQIDASDGTLDQNLEVFGYRDAVMVALGGGFAPAFGSTMSSLKEDTDNNHTNIYHYMIDFVSAVVDSKGSPFDPDSSMIGTTPPTNAEIDVSITTSY